MAKFRVEQTVLCEVRVWNVVDAPTHAEALAIISKVDSPTSGSLLTGTDYEIISDKEIINTKVETI